MLSAHESLSPPMGCISKTGWFLEQGRWSCSSTGCPAAGRLSTLLSGSAVGTPSSQQLCTGPNKTCFSSLPTGDLFWKMASTPPFHGIHTRTCAAFQPQPCQGLSFSTATEGQEGQPALRVWPEPGQHLSLFITQPCLPSALALRCLSLHSSPTPPLIDQFCDTSKGRQ